MDPLGWEFFARQGIPTAVGVSLNSHCGGGDSFPVVSPTAVGVLLSVKTCPIPVGVPLALCLPHTGGSPSQLWFSPTDVGVYLDSGESPRWWGWIGFAKGAHFGGSMSICSSPAPLLWEQNPNVSGLC